MSYQIPDFDQARVVVVGDVMLDRYWHGSTERISPEAPVPVVNIQDLSEQPGGAANVAVNLRTLGCDVRLFGMIGDDDAGKILHKQLADLSIATFLQSVPDLRTITKLRVIGRNQQLLRLDFEQGFHQVDGAELLTKIKTHLQAVDVLVISDYNKGIVSNIPQIISLARAANIPVLVDPKNSDFSVYSGATILTPNLKEFEAVVGTCKDQDDLVRKGTQLLHDINLEALLITRSEKGMTLLQKNQEAIHVGAIAQEVFDVTGAGDTVISMFAAALAGKVSLETAVTLANTAAGIAVSKLGAASVTVPELRRALRRRYDSDLGVLTHAECLLAVADAKAHGELIVMTNGCFDILHAGHVSYLERAKALGKRLLVAVNDDASVARLKGPTRPIVPLAQRMQVLAGLQSVDWVVSFTEDTPLRIITEVSPDVLVKGADYNIDQIVGAPHVLSTGGRVETIETLNGISTTNIVSRIQELGADKCIS